MKLIKQTWLRGELLYDIKNACYVEADVMKTEDDHDRHQVFDVGEEGNVDRVQRWMDLAWAKCVEALYPLSRRDVDEGMWQDDILQYYDYYYMEMNVPDRFSRTTLNLITRLVHEFIVSAVVCDWLSITYPSRVEMWRGKAALLLDELKGTASRSGERAVIRLWPHG